jgi:hypothetical protein
MSGPTFDELYGNRAGRPDAEHAKWPSASADGLDPPPGVSQDPEEDITTVTIHIDADRPVRLRVIVGPGSELVP